MNLLMLCVCSVNLDLVFSAVLVAVHLRGPSHRQGHLLCYRAKDRGQGCSQTLTILCNPVRNREVLIKTRFESEDEVCVAAARV